MNESVMRQAFAAATANLPMTKHTRLYAMVRSALGRRLGVARPTSGWSVTRRGRRQ